MVRILSNYILRYRLEKQLNSLSSVSKKNLKQFKTMIVLLPQEYEVNEQLFLTFSEEFKISIQNITLVVFSQNDSKAENMMITNRVYCSSNAVGFWGNINQDLTSLFQDEFDLLINYFDEQKLLPSYVSTFCKAKVRLGFSNANHKLNDLILAINPKETELFLSNASKYLKIILKKV